MPSRLRDTRTENLTEEEFLEEEALQARAAIRRTMRDLARTSGQFVRPRQAFGAHPWISTGVIIGVSAVVGLLVYEAFFREKDQEPRESRHSHDAAYSNAGRVGGWAKPVLRALAALTGVVVKVVVPLASADPESTRLKSRHR